LEKFNGFMNDLSIRVEGGWPPPDNLPDDEDLLHTLGLSPRVTPNHTGSNTDFYPYSESNQGVQTLRKGAPKRFWIPEESTSGSRKKTESDRDSTFHNTINKGLPAGSKTREDKRRNRRDSEDIELPFQEGVPLQEEDNQKTLSPDREIFMAIISEIMEHEDDPMERVDLVDYNSSDYDEYLSDAEATEIETVNYKIPPPPLGVTVTVHLDDEQNKLKKIHN